MTESASSYLSSEPGASAGINTPSSFKHYKSFHSIKESIDFDVQYKTEAARIQILEKIHVIKVIIVKLESSGISEFQCNIKNRWLCSGKTRTLPDGRKDWLIAEVIYSEGSPSIQQTQGDTQTHTAR